MQENHREITCESYLTTGEFFMNHDVRVLFKSERVAILVYLRSRSFRVSRDPTRTNLISGFMMDCIEAVSWFRFLSRLKFSTFFRWFRLFLIRFSCFSWRDLNEIVQNTKPVSFRIEKNLKIDLWATVKKGHPRVIWAFFKIFMSAVSIFLLSPDMKCPSNSDLMVVWGSLGLKVIGRKE